MPDIYIYSNYRQYIKDYYIEKKGQNPRFSYSVFSRKATIKGSGFLIQVIKGERNLTQSVLLKVAKAMGLTEQATEYFEYLVKFDQAKTQTERDYLFLKIKAHRKTVSVKDLQDDQFDFYSKWYHSVIREVVGLIDEKVTPAQLAKVVIPAISTPEAKESLSFLINAQLVRVLDNGRIVPTDSFVKGKSSAFTKTVMLNFQKEFMQLALQAFSQFNEKEFSMHTVTFSVSEDRLPDIVREIRDFKQRLLALVETDPAQSTRVHHLNINMFPVSQQIERRQE